MLSEKFFTFGWGPKVTINDSYIHLAVSRQARQTPQAIAVEHGDRKLSYRQLDQQANTVAHSLIQQGVKVGEHVGVFIERSPEMVVAILAVLKVGAIYVPQDPRITPTAQLQYIIDCASITTVLTLWNLQSLIPCRSLAVDSLPTRQLPVIDRRHQHCCLIFTSGTTGHPNGVRITHRNICNILLTAPGNLAVKQGDRVGQLLNISFDMAIWEIFVALAHGATLVVRGKNIAETARKTNIVIATPSILARINPHRIGQITTVAVAGEPCPLSLADSWAKRCLFYNCCGPTETTIVNTMKQHQVGQVITIGKPTANNRVYILDRTDNTPCRIGEIGEMWAAGAGVTAGYLANETLTANRYRPDPFSDGLMFKTGDLGRWTTDGELEHLGRTDNQIKIKGFRVELDSVSKVLEKECEQAITIVDNSDLISYVRPQTVDINTLYQQLNDNLPYFCRPQKIIPLDRFPQTTRGKIDKRQLLAMLPLEKKQ